MPKIRKINSIEKSIQEVFKILNEDDVKKAIGKSTSYLRKCGDEEALHKLQFDDAIKLDRASLNKKDISPFLNLYQYLLSSESLTDHKENNSSEILHLLSFEVGKIAKEYIEAIKEESRGGSKITDDEKSRIYDEIISVENNLKKLKKSLEIS